MQGGKISADLPRPAALQHQASTFYLRTSNRKGGPLHGQLEGLDPENGGAYMLINTMLGGLPTYAMGAMVLPPCTRCPLPSLPVDRHQHRLRSTMSCGVGKGLQDQRRRGGGALIIRRLVTQNTYLLLKLVHRLYHQQGSAWVIKLGK